MFVPRLLQHPNFYLDEVGELLVSIAALGLSLGLWSAARSKRTFRGAEVVGES
jgi:hypothetical protein